MFDLECGVSQDIVEMIRDELKLFRKDVPQNYESYCGVVPWLFGQFQHWFGVVL